MEKFQKYCLSVLLVIICGNISAQIVNGSIEPHEYKKLCEIYTQLLDSQDSGSLQDCPVTKKTKHYYSIHHKQNVVGVIGKAVSEKEYGKINNGIFFGLESVRHYLALLNFESNNTNSYTGTLYFKTKVSKIRNKDYLDLLS